MTHASESAEVETNTCWVYVSLNLDLILEARRMRRRPDARHGGFRQVNMQNSARKMISRDQHATGMVSTTLDKVIL